MLDIPETLTLANSFLFGSWTMPGLQEWGVIAALALAMLIGSIWAAVEYQIGPPPVVTTFDYAYLVFASLWGALLFGEFQDRTTLVGMIMIATCGVLALRRGRR